MRCEQAQQLFDGYLNGELSPSLSTELGAHRVSCSSCRRAMALLEVSGHIITSDRETATLREGFSDRLLACMEAQPISRARQWRRRLYIVGSLAAAAVVVLAFLGAFGRRDNLVAGKKVEFNAHVQPAHDVDQPLPDGDAQANDPGARRLDAWAEQTQKNLSSKRQSSEALQNAFGDTLEQLLEALQRVEQENVAPKAPPPNSASESPEPPGTPPLAGNDGDRP